MHETDQGPLINQIAVEKIERHIQDAVGKGAKVAMGGNRIEGNGNFFAPTVLIDVPQDALLNSEETFGPVAPLIRFDSEQEVIQAANATPYGLRHMLSQMTCAASGGFQNSWKPVLSGSTQAEFLPKLHHSEGLKNLDWDVKGQSTELMITWN